MMSCAGKEFNLFPIAGKHSTGAKFGKTISWGNAREKNSTCFQARENIQLVPSGGKQLGDSSGIRLRGQIFTPFEK